MSKPKVTDRLPQLDPAVADRVIPVNRRSPILPLTRFTEILDEEPQYRALHRAETRAGEMLEESRTEMARIEVEVEKLWARYGKLHVAGHRYANILRAATQNLNLHLKRRYAEEVKRAMLDRLDAK